MDFSPSPLPPLESNPTSSLLHYCSGLLTGFLSSLWCFFPSSCSSHTDLLSLLESTNLLPVSRLKGHEDFFHQELCSLHPLPSSTCATPVYFLGLSLNVMSSGRPSLTNPNPTHLCSLRNLTLLEHHGWFAFCWHILSNKTLKDLCIWIKLLIKMRNVTIEDQNECGQVHFSSGRQIYTGSQIACAYRII